MNIDYKEALFQVIHGVAYAEGVYFDTDWVWQGGMSEEACKQIIEEYERWAIENEDFLDGVCERKIAEEKAKEA